MGVQSKTRAFRSAVRRFQKESKFDEASAAEVSPWFFTAVELLDVLPRKHRKTRFLGGEARKAILALVGVS